MELLQLCGGSYNPMTLHLNNWMIGLIDRRRSCRDSAGNCPHRVQELSRNAHDQFHLVGTRVFFKSRFRTGPESPRILKNEPPMIGQWDSGIPHPTFEHLTVNRYQFINRKTSGQLSSDHQIRIGD